MGLTVFVNGQAEALEVGAGDTLLEVLRDRLHLTGAKEGCREGECGACTVLVNGRPIHACIYAAMATDGCRVETVEGLGSVEHPSALQRAMVEAGGTQCGFCTPGFVVMLTALLRECSEPTREQVRESLSGNICRCTGYAQIEEAVMRVVTETSLERDQ